MNNIILFSLISILSFKGFATTLDNNSEKPKKDMIQQSLIWQNRERNYWLHLPPQAKMEVPLAILFHLHGGGGTGKGTPRLTYKGFNKIADREGVIVVYPDAIAKNWNDGRTAHLKPENADVDDVGFIVEIINRLKNTYTIDPNRIFTTGMSNGGFMSSRLLCDRADLFRGGAVLTASLSVEYLEKCKPEKPVAVLVMNGTDDPIVPYAGGDVRLFKWAKSRGKVLSNDAYVALWKEKNGCTEVEPTVDLPDTNKRDGTTVSITSYSNCETGGALKFYKINGGGHTWPGGKQYLGKRLIGKTSREINACDEIWAFFSSLE